MSKKIISVMTAFFVLFSMFPAYSAYAADAEKEVSLWYLNTATETMEEADKVELFRGGELNLSVKIKDDIDGDVQWQIKSGAKTWVDIQDGTDESLRVSYGMVQGLLKHNTAHIRCAVFGNEEYCSEPVKIAVTDEDNRAGASSDSSAKALVAPAQLPAPVAVQLEDETMEKDEVIEESDMTEEPSVEEAQSAEALLLSGAETETDADAEAEQASENEAVVETENAEEPAPMADGNLPDETKTYHTVIIEYVYSEASQFDGKRVALPYIAEVESGDTLTATVPSPNCVGYNPDMTEFKLSDLGPIIKNETYTVKYSPAEVSYTVRHYQQNVDDDEYTWVDTTMATGLTESQTKNENAANTYDGFTALEHYSEPIAADSSTMIDVYYDRNYYLMSFDLDGGNGVNPVYARYGADLSVGTPSKMGWKFAGWKDAPGTAGQSVTIPNKIPNGDRTFYAVWEQIPDGTTYSVAYWIDNGDGTKTYLTTKTETAGAGDKVSGTDDIGTANVCGIEEHTHTADCFEDSEVIEIGTTFSNNNYMNAIDDANDGVDPSELYFYAVRQGTSGNYTPVLYIDGEYYNISVNGSSTIAQSVISSIAEGEYIADGRYRPNRYTTYYYAYKYELKMVDSSGNTIISCGKTTHSHSAACKSETARYLDLVSADQNVEVKGDGTTVVNVYYKYRTYTIRYVYARRTGNNYNYQYQIATLTNNGTLNGCQWTNVNDLPNFEDPSGNTVRSYFTDGNTRYYYISLTAKFGEDISGSWPAANIDDVNGYNWGSWAAAAGTGYRKKYGDEHANIVGIYPTMSADMIGQNQELLRTENGTNIYLAQNMIAWWAGNNNGVANHAYHNYFEVVGTPQAGDIQYNGKHYRLNETIVFTAAHNGSTRVDPIGYNGYTCINDTNGTSNDRQANSSNFANNGNCAICNKYETDNNATCDYCNIFYYDANKYKLSFWNHNEWLTSYKDIDVTYSSLLSGYESTATAAANANYPSGLEAGVYKFAGWYTTKECYPGSEVSWSNLKMPASNLIIYAKWVPITREVKIYKTEGGEQLENSPMEVTHGQLVPADKRPDESTLKHPSDKEATFIGWFYKDAKGDEHAFDFASMAIVQDMSIYAKWRSNVMKHVEIYYVVEDENGVRTEVADSESVMLRLGQTRTFDAKVGSSLYQEFRTGCFPATASHSITITDADIESTDPVRYTFVYKKCGHVPYQVEFYLIDENGNERPAFRKDENGKAVFVEYGQWSNTYEGYAEEHWDNNKSIVTELYVPDNLATETWTLPDAYLPDALKLQKVIIPSSTDPENNIAANIIKFVYTYTEPEVDPDNPGTPVYKGRYLVQHFIQDPENPTQYLLHDNYEDLEGYAGQTAKANPASIPGYTYSYDVTNANKQAGTTLNKDTGEMTGTINAKDSLELNFYYTANAYPYKVMYLEEGNNRPLAAEKTLGDNGKQLKGLYGEKVTETAIDIEGYDVVGASEKSIYIQMEAGDTANVNTIVFYYKQKSAELRLSKTVELDPTQAAQEGISKIPSWVYDQDFEFTIFHKSGFPKSLYRYTLYSKEHPEGEEKAVSADVQTITIKLKPGEIAQIHEMPMGAYTVTETYVPGFKATDEDGYIATTQTVSMNNDKEVGSIAFNNIFPFYTGDLVVKKDVTKQKPSDPAATEPYQVSVVLKPHDVAREVDRVITFVDKDGNPVTDKDGNSSFTIPKLAVIDEEHPSGDTFTINVLVPVDGEVKLKDVPVGTFTATEVVKGTIGYIYDYYTVKYNKAVHENDEVKGTNHIVNGDIHGGHPTAVTFHNTYKKGDLKINKTVKQEYVDDSWTEDTFTFKIEGTTELPDGTYSIKAGGENDTVTVTGGKIEFTGEIEVSKEEGKTSWTESLLYEELPAGYYTVTETAAGLGLDNYSVTMVSDPDTGLANDTDNAVVFDINNEYKRTKGSLKVGKEIRIVTEGATIDENQDFTFVVELKDGTLNGDYDCVVKNKQSDAVVTGSPVKLTADKNQLTFTLRHNQYILIDDLPVGNYLVKEEALEGYDSSFSDVVTNPKNYYVDPAVIKTNKTTELNCQNAYPVYYSNLIVKKEVVTPADNASIDKAPADDVFTFTVSISGYSDKISLAGGIRAKFYENASDTTPVEKALPVTGDTVTFELKANEWVDMGMPACTYTIAETGLSSTVNTDVLADHYTTEYTVRGAAGAEGDSFNLLSGEKDNVVFTNTYKRHLLDLTITTPNYAHPDQSFVFVVSGTPDDTAKFGDNITQKVVLVGDDSQTIKNLPAGQYMVGEPRGEATTREQPGWTWRENQVNPQTVELRTSDVTVPFVFGELDVVYWLSDYSYNLHKKGGN